jgi:hypothetical protein
LDWAMGKPQNACPDVPLIAKKRLLALESLLFQANLIHDEVDLEDYEGTVTYYLYVAKLQAMSQCFPPLRSNSSTGSQRGKKLYLRPLQKRSHLVDFVIKNQLTMRTRKNVSRRRFNWRQMCDRWNDAHSYDIMKPSVLKATYYRAAADKEVQKAVITRQTKLLVKSLKKALDEEWIDEGVIDNLRIFLQIPINKMPSRFQEGYSYFIKVMGDALEDIYRP